MGTELILLAMDPGLRGCGLALFEDRKLAHAWYCKNPNKSERGPEAYRAMGRAVVRELYRLVPGYYPMDRFVSEIPQVYRGPRMGGDPADLLELTGVVGSVVSEVPFIVGRGVLPRTWKKQQPKEVHHPRILSSLDASERANIVPGPKYLLHNTYDAIGIGLFDLLRLTP